MAEQSGAKSQLTGLVGAGLVAVLLLFLNGLLADLPQSALAAVVIAAALSLLNLPVLVRFWSVRRSSVVLSVIASLGVIFIGVLEGIVIASLVNIFLASSMLQFVVSVVGVLVFAGLTAWDTQRLKNDYIYGYASQGGEMAEKAAITGALSLYLNFINLFTLLLQLLGQRD